MSETRLTSTQLTNWHVTVISVNGTNQAYHRFINARRRLTKKAMTSTAESAEPDYSDEHVTDDVT